MYKFILELVSSHRLKLDKVTADFYFKKKKKKKKKQVRKQKKQVFWIWYLNMDGILKANFSLF